MKRRRPLTKTHLLPLPAALARQQQLRHHVALSMLLDQCAGHTQLVILLNVVEMTYLLALPAELETISIDRFRQAEMALEAQFGQCAEGGGELESAQREVIERILAMHDEQLLRVSSHRYLEAQERCKRLAEAGRSAIPS